MSPSAGSGQGVSDDMRIAIGSDHRGVAARRRLIGLLQRLGNEVVDCGSDGEQAVDYPDIAADVARRVSDGSVDRGILLCCTGVGMAIAANKLPGVRAATCHDEVTAEMSRRHNDLNVLSLSAELIGPEVQDKIIRTWLTTPFEGGRHARRVAKIAALECHSKDGAAAGG
ncbi:MAG: ribose 5-phosphate isomerase B [Pirellulales bacterium]